MAGGGRGRAPAAGGQQAPPELRPDQLIRSLGDMDLYALRHVANMAANPQQGTGKIPPFVQRQLKKNPVAGRMAQAIMQNPKAREVLVPLVRQRMAEAGIGEMGAAHGVPRSASPAGKRARARTGLLGGRISALQNRAKGVGLVAPPDIGGR